jgi:hypothetical protein
MVRFYMFRVIKMVIIVLVLAGAACGNQPQSVSNGHQQQTMKSTPTIAPHQASATTTPSGNPDSGKAPTVFMILLENHNWSAIQGNPDAPYINNTLLPMASYALQYYNPPYNHPSTPNYLWLEAGTNFGIGNDGLPADNDQSTRQHLTTLLMNAHISWKAYEEGIDGTTCQLDRDGYYDPNHNPMIYFDDVTNSNDPNSAYCIAHERPYSEFARDLQHQTVARYNFITPNICDDMHSDCPPTANAIHQGDAWLSKQVPLILNSQAYKNNGVLFITWDEGEGRDGPIGMIVLSPDAKGHGYSNTIHYTHSSTLRTVQEIFGVKPFLGDAARSNDLSDLFRTLP